MSAPKYLTIIKKIEGMIRSGEFPEGSKLPTHRDLAKQLETTPITVAKAYKELAEKKLIESFVGRGSFVCHPPQLSDVIRAQTDEKQHNLSILQPCLSVQASRLNEAMMQVLQTSNHYLYGYIEHSGLALHRDMGARWARHYGLDVTDGASIVLTGGAQHALAALIECYTKAGDTLAVEAMTYPGILSIATLLNRKVVAVAMDQEGMIPDALSRVCQEYTVSMAIVVPSHQNPTTATMSLARRQELARVIQQEQIWLIEDDIYGFLNQDVIPAITNFVPELAFHISSLSKAISPGLRCGYVKTPVNEHEQFTAFIRATMWMPVPMMFALAAQLVESGEAFVMAEHQRAIADRRQILAGEILGNYQRLNQTASYHFWLELPEVWSPDLFTLMAKDRGLVVSSASYFKADPHAQTPAALRISLMAIEDELVLVNALRKLTDLLGQNPHTHLISS